MISAEEAAFNLAIATKPKDNVVPIEGVSDLNIDVIIAGCKSRGIDIEEYIANYLALGEADATRCEYNPLKLKKEQIDALLKLLDKKIANRKPVDEVGDSDDKLTVTVNLGQYPDPE